MSYCCHHNCATELNKNVQQLIRYQPASWIMSGYLMLRMKLPNNRYAWSYIVSIVSSVLLVGTTDGTRTELTGA